MHVSETSPSPSVQTLKNKLRLSSEVLDSAKEKLLKLLEREDTEELVTDKVVTQEEIEEEEDEPVDDLENGIVIARNISLDAFLKYQETGSTVKMSLSEGEVIVHEVPLGPHAVVSGEIVGQMKIWYNSLMTFAARDVIYSSSGSIIPDGSVQPRDLTRPPAGQGCDKYGCAYPTVVVEVGFSEGIRSLHSKAIKYFSQRTTVQVYIAVKIFTRRRDGTRTLIVFVYERASNNSGRPVLVKSFGTAPMHIRTLRFFRRMGVPDQNITGVGRHSAPACNRPGIQVYQINIPAAAIFNGSPAGIPVNLGNGFNLDLYVIQDAFLSL